MRVKCLTQEHNTMTQPGLEPGPLDPESSALTTRPQHLPFGSPGVLIIYMQIARVIPFETVVNYGPLVGVKQSFQ